VQTSAIGHRVVDHLKQHPPFQAMAEEDLLGLVQRGRVRFHETDEFVYWQGRPHGAHLFVIRQGTVSLWDEQDGRQRLQDVRGPGDLLGVDRFLGSAVHVHSAKAASDVVLYAIEAADFEPLLERYPKARRYLAAHFSAGAYDEPADGSRPAHQAFAYEHARRPAPPAGRPGDALADAARRMSASGLDPMAVVDAEGRLAGVLTAARTLAALAEAGAASRTVADVMDEAPIVVSPEATVDACVLAMAGAGAEVVAITEGGARAGRLQALVTARDLGRAFGEQPLALFQEAARAAAPEELRAANKRFRAFLLEQLTGPSSVEWLCGLASRFDRLVFERLLDQLGAPGDASCGWFFLGSTARGETLTPLPPQVGLVHADGGDASFYRGWLERVTEARYDCGYVRPPSQSPVEFRGGSLGEWRARFQGFVRDPVGSQLYKARPLFDLRPVRGGLDWLAPLAAEVRAEVAAHAAFMEVLAHDCLANLPPLSFFRDLVVDESGGPSVVFELERSALRPLVDVARVFGIAAGHVLGGSTLERLEWGRVRHGDHEAVFRDASDTLRVLLHHQGRAGIRAQGNGSVLAPSSLSRHDRQALKAGFRSILRLLELAGECRWPRS
jgi:CBS domain-containing protein